MYLDPSLRFTSCQYLPAMIKYVCGLGMDEFVSL